MNNDSLVKGTSDVLKDGKPTSVIGAVALGALAVGMFAIKTIGEIAKK